MKRLSWRPGTPIGEKGGGRRHGLARTRAGRRTQLVGCTAAALAAVFGLGPIVAPLVLSSASAATTNCSASTSGATALSRTGWTASSNTNSATADQPSNAIDGNIDTRFSSDAVQAAGQTLEVNLGSAQTFNTLDMDSTDWPGDYAVGYNVNVSTNGTSWTTVASCAGTGTPEVVSFGTVTDQYLEVVLTAASTGSWWSIGELNLYNVAGGTTTTTAAPTTTTTAAPTTTTTKAPTANCSAAVSGTELSQSGWTASTNTDASGGDVASNAIDGNLTTRFSSDEFQAAGQDLVINLGSAKAFDELEMAVPNSNGDYARGYSVEVSSNGTSWTTVATCTGTGTPEVVSFGTVTDQYVEVVLTAASTTSWWSVDELDLYSAGGGTTTTTAAPTTTTTAAPTTTTTTAPAANCSAAVSGTELSQSGWTASTNTDASGGDVASNAIDGNLTTRFSSDEFQAAGQDLVINLGSAKAFDELDLAVPNSNGDYARGYSVEVSTNGTSWTPVASCTGTGTPEVVSFGTVTDQYVEVVLTAASTTSWWSVDELDLYSASGGTTTTTAAPTTTTTAAPTTTTTAPSGANCSAAVSGTELSQSGWTASTNTDASGGDVASNAIDGNLTTRFSSDEFQAAGQDLVINLGSAKAFDELDLAVPNSNGDYARGYSVEVSSNGTSWTTVATCTGTGTPEVVSFGTVTDQYVEVVLTAASTTSWWSVDELDLYSAGGGTTTTTVAPTTTTTAPSSWTPVWAPSLSGAAGSAPSSSDWLEDTGTAYPGGPATWGTGEVETMSNSTSNVYLDGNGHLDIKATDNGGSWTSGRVESQQSSFEAPAGGEMMITASIELPNVANGLGYWPAFNVIGSAFRGNYNNLPGVGESDIMEAPNLMGETSETFHCGTAPGPCDEPTGYTSNLAYYSGLSTSYNTYSEIIDRTTSNEQVRYYINGTQVYEVSESQVGAAVWQAAVDHSFLLEFDLAIGGAYPNEVCGCTSPSSGTSSGGVLSIGSVGVYYSTPGATPPAYTTPPVPSGGNVVKVTGTSGNWNLQVNGANYYVKGLTWGNDNTSALAYMPNLQSMGVNTLRTWGTDSTTAPLLQASSQYGIKVINGFWLNYGTDWINDTSYEQSEESTILQYVDQYASNPGTLMWDVGNEVMLNNADYFSGAQLQQENQAYLQYVNTLAQAIHAADPNHPVTSTEAYRPIGTVAGEPNGIFALYQEYAPSLDLWAVNSYGTIGDVYPDWEANGASKPYIVTEAGSYGEWEAPTDPFGAPLQENDAQMVSGYETSWSDITAHPNDDLGATMFNYGLQDDLGGVWYNIMASNLYRPIGYAISDMFGGTFGSNGDQAPNFSAMSVTNDASVPAGGQFTVNMTVSSPENYPLHYGVLLSDRYLPVPDGCGPAWCSLSNSGLSWATFTQTGPTTLSVTAPDWQGIWKVYVYAYDGHGNVGIDNESFMVVPPPVSGTDIALNKPVTDSSEQDATGSGCPCTGADAVDGNLTTRWASNWSDPQWLEVNLGSVQPIDTVQLVWEDAYASAYEVQVSNDGTNWTTVYSQGNGQGGVETIPLSGVSGQYVRFYGTARATSYGYSLWEMGVYN